MSSICTSFKLKYTKLRYILGDRSVGRKDKVRLRVNLEGKLIVTKFRIAPKMKSVPLPVKRGVKTLT